MIASVCIRIRMWAFHRIAVVTAIVAAFLTAVGAAIAVFVTAAVAAFSHYAAPAGGSLVLKLEEKCVKSFDYLYEVAQRGRWLRDLPFRAERGYSRCAFSTPHTHPI